jgi:uncharacterized protein (TIGR03067 family)
MPVKFVVALVVVLSFSLAAWSDDAKDGDALEGAWLPATAEFAGNTFPDEVRKTMKLVIKGDKFSVSVGKVVDQGTIKLDASAKPKKMETVCTDGPNKGRTFPAIYELDRDTLKICYNLSGKSHPTEFKTKEGSQLFLVTYKREKP